MRKEEITIYNLDELSEKAQEKAHNDFCNSDFYPWGSDNEKTLKEFANIFPVKIGHWEYGYRNDINFSMTCEDEISELSGIRLATYIYNNYSRYLYKGKYYSTKGYYDENKKYHYKYRHSNIIKDNSCVLTGYCIDDDILQPVYDFMRDPSGMTFEELMSECLNAWVTACNKDYEYYYSFESFKEMSECNEWEYTEDGELF